MNLAKLLTEIEARLKANVKFEPLYTDLTRLLAIVRLQDEALKFYAGQQCYYAQPEEAQEARQAADELAAGGEE